jgi:colicin import membrane protein
VATDTLLPQRPQGMAPGALLSLLVHVGLIAALTLGVGWRMKAPEVVSAELWASLPQVAAPKSEEPPAPAPPPAPPPQPTPRVATPPAPTPEAQIATERAERARREEAERAAEEAAKKRERDKREADEKRQRDKELRAAEDKRQREEQAKADKAEKARVDKLREDQLKRMQGALQGSSNPQSTGSAAQDAGPSRAYASKLIDLLRRNVTYNGSPSENPAALVRITAAPGGTIIARRLVKSSGVPDYDEAVLRAVDKLGRLPADTDGKVPTDIEVTFRLRE